MGKKTIAFIADYLNGRTQQVVIGGARSSSIDVLSGVPQDSCLGPILFCLFINDLPSSVQHSTVKMFADDVKLYLPVRDQNDVQLLQEDLDSLTYWCESNSMFINPSKCVVLHYARKLPPVHTYQLSGIRIPSNEIVPDLGVYFDTQLKFDKHVSEIVRNANYRLSSIRRSFSRFNLRNFLLLYKSMVRPLLEYNTSVWFPLSLTDEHRIEKVQRRATRLVPYLQRLSYPQRLSRLQLPSLKFRRRRNDLVNLFRIIKGVDDVDPNLFFKFSHYHSTRQHDYKLYPPKPLKKIGQLSFVSRVAGPWNGLPLEVVEAESVRNFKSALVNTPFYLDAFVV